MKAFCFGVIYSNQVARLPLKCNLQFLATWFNDSYMKLNPAKYNDMVLGRNSNVVNYVLISPNNTKLNSCDEAWDYNSRNIISFSVRKKTLCRGYIYTLKIKICIKYKTWNFPIFTIRLETFVEWGWIFVELCAIW